MTLIKKHLGSFLLFILPFVLTFCVALADEVDSEALEADAKALETLLISPCCWRQPVSVHFSPAADEVREDVRKMLASGLSREEILEKYVAQYGERILSKPPAEGFGIFAYFLPVVFVGVGGCLAVFVIGKLRPKKLNESTRSESKAVDPSDYASKLDKEMWG